MESKRLRRLSKKSLLQIMLAQAKRIEELEAELKSTKEKLDDKKVNLKDVGSLAEASLVLSDMFKQADEAIAIQMKYIENIEQEEIKRVKKEMRELRKKEKEKQTKNSEVKEKKKIEKVVVIKDGKKVNEKA